MRWKLSPRCAVILGSVLHILHDEDERKKW